MNVLLPGGSASLTDLDARARDIFRRVVETYLETGEPVGSRTVSRGGMALSPASIRNTMQDLTMAGLLASPHTSAGRVPTHAGLRLFVDGLLEIGDLTEEERREIDGRLAGRGRSFEEALAVLVAEDGAVENRLMRLSAGVTPATLREASNFLNARLKGRPLAEAQAEMRAELDRARTELDAAAARLVEDGLAAWAGGAERERALIVRGRANLLQDREALEDLERVRGLMEDLEQKAQLIGLLDGVADAQGVRIFIGAETRLFSLSGSAVVAAPYMSGRQRVLGAIGVIGPARLNYARIIPLVDYTARVLGRILDGNDT